MVKCKILSLSVYFLWLAVTWMNKLTFVTLLFFSTVKILFRIFTSAEIVNKSLVIVTCYWIDKISTTWQWKLS